MLGALQFLQVALDICRKALKIAQLVQQLGWNYEHSFAVNLGHSMSFAPIGGNLCEVFSEARLFSKSRASLGVIGVSIGLIWPSDEPSSPLIDIA